MQSGTSHHDFAEVLQKGCCYRELKAEAEGVREGSFFHSCIARVSHTELNNSAASDCVWVSACLPHCVIRGRGITSSRTPLRLIKKLH